MQTITSNQLAFSFWKNNKKDQHFILNAQELKSKFQTWLASQTKEYLQYYSCDILIRVFITDEKGLVSSFDEQEFQNIYYAISAAYYSRIKDIA